MTILRDSPDFESGPPGKRIRLELQPMTEVINHEAPPQPASRGPSSTNTRSTGRRFRGCSCRSRTATTVAEEGEDRRTDQRQSGWLRDRGGDADHLFRTQKRDAGVKSSIDRVEESIRDQTLSDGPGVEAVGKEQVLGVVTRVDAVDFEATDDIRPGPCDLGEKLVDIDEDDPLAVVQRQGPGGGR